MVTLTACYGMFLGMCGMIYNHDFKTFRECEYARKELVKQKPDGLKYALCVPKQQHFDHASRRKG